MLYGEFTVVRLVRIMIRVLAVASEVAIRFDSILHWGIVVVVAVTNLPIMIMVFMVGSQNGNYLVFHTALDWSNANCSSFHYHMLGFAPLRARMIMRS